MEDLTVSGAWYKGERNTHDLIPGKKKLDFTQLGREIWKEQPLVFASNALKLKCDLSTPILHRENEMQPPEKSAKSQMYSCKKAVCKLHANELSFSKSTSPSIRKGKLN